jgi:hypothetical protein
MKLENLRDRKVESPHYELKNSELEIQRGRKVRESAVHQKQKNCTPTTSKIPIPL